jgi:hypothetical protein
MYWKRANRTPSAMLIRLWKPIESLKDRGSLEVKTMIRPIRAITATITYATKNA